MAISAENPAEALPVVWSWPCLFRSVSRTQSLVDVTHIDDDDVARR